MKTIKSNNKAINLSFKIASYFFIVIAILTAFGYNAGTWV